MVNKDGELEKVMIYLEAGSRSAPQPPIRSLSLKLLDSYRALVCRLPPLKEPPLWLPGEMLNMHTHILL